MKKPSSGFSLIELLIALAVVGIGLAVTVPAMRDFTNSNRQVEQINKLVHDINYAKSEAVTRGSTVIISQLGSTAGDWYDGWQVTSGGSVIKSTPALTAPNSSLLETSGHTAVYFRASGPATGYIDSTSDSNAISFELCDTTTNANDVDKQLDVRATGRIVLDSKFDCTP